MSNLRQFLWILYGAGVGFGSSFVFGDLLMLPLDLYYLIYFVIVLGFLGLWAKRTKLDVRAWTSRRLGWGIIAGLLVGALMVAGVLNRPPTEGEHGLALVWLVFWRGVLYGAVDGLLLTVFPWVVTWRALDGESKPFLGKVRVTLVAWVFVLVTTTAYHAGYSDFRSGKILQPAIGNTMISLATFLSANPVASVITHAAMHVAAVIHSPGTELYLPPHR
jgi:hypothetical protein